MLSTTIPPLAHSPFSFVHEFIFGASICNTKPAFTLISKSLAETRETEQQSTGERESSEEFVRSFIDFIDSSEIIQLCWNPGAVTTRTGTKWRSA